MGRVMGMMANVRHLVIRDGYLYLSVNKTGYVQRIKLDKFLEAAKRLTGKTVTLQGWENCKVGDGARTIELSPSGHFVFAACNLASRLYVVDTRDMKVVGSIEVDSYPVGLDISNDGRYVIVTSQGRGNQGGNAVNIYEVEYEEAEPVLKNTDGAAVLEWLEHGDSVAPQKEEKNLIASSLPLVKGDEHTTYLIGGACAVAALLAAFFFVRRKRS
jgi:DNA-binding beta-propeller fold protein YncE